ncbi:MAG: aromatic ring-hydroxylating dioxygenase subunit alpha [Candidatus Rokubacteria bacterium]|nr:aromatic ring-hydroxylating dioxygenase subunit alpha [Candidatus Rokubacteria bacterium]
MSAKVETLFRGDTGQLQRRIAITEKLTPAYFEQEREKIFRRAWLPIGHASDVPDDGSYFVREMPTLRTSLLVTRGQDGQVRAFHNACTHRGNKLVREGSGCSRTLSCGFHGWTFSCEGELLVVTDEAQFRDLDKRVLGLRPVPTEVWEDLIFINVEDEPRESLREWLGEMHDEYHGYFEQHQRAASNRVIVRSNWNLAVNSFTEGYHTLYLHKRSVPDYQGGRINPERHRPFMQLFKRHHRYSAPANPDHKLTPAEALAIKYGRKLIPAFDGDMTGMPPGVNPSRYEHWAFDVVQFFPNAVFLFGNHWHIEIFFWPIDADHTEIVQDLWYYKPRNAGERISHQFFASRGRQVFLEDLNTLEAQHGVLSSGSLTHVQLSQQEMSLQHHYKVVTEMLAEP